MWCRKRMKPRDFWRSQLCITGASGSDRPSGEAWTVLESRFVRRVSTRSSSLTSVTNVVFQSVLRAAPGSVDLKPSNIPPEWVLDGSPKVWNKEVASSPDQVSQIFVWECTAGHFMWRYSKHESMIVISGEAFLIEDNGQEV